MRHKPTQNKNLLLAPKICVCVYVSNSLTGFRSVLGRVLDCGSSWSELRGASILPSWQGGVAWGAVQGEGTSCALCQRFGRTGVGNGSGWLHLLSFPLIISPQCVCPSLMGIVSRAAWEELAPLNQL